MWNTIRRRIKFYMDSTNNVFQKFIHRSQSLITNFPKIIIKNIQKTARWPFTEECKMGSYLSRNTGPVIEAPNSMANAK